MRVQAEVGEVGSEVRRAGDDELTTRGGAGLPEPGWPGTFLRGAPRGRAEELGTSLCLVEVPEPEGESAQREVSLWSMEA